MEKVKAFLKRKNIVLSVRRYGIEALGAMAQGLFCTLLVGTILNTVGAQFGIGFLKTVIVTIGSGEGQNWWCVVFPSLCVSATSDGMEDAAVGAGFSDRLTGTISGKQEYRVRFFILDCFGWVENWLHGM